MSAELDAVEQAREDVEQELAKPERDVDELVERAAELGWHLGRAAPDVPPGIQVDRSSETPAVRSTAEDILRRQATSADPYASIPIHRQVADQLQDLIRTGHLKPGQRLPSEAKIAREYAVGVHTARHAIRVLHDRGMVITEPTKGTFVAHRRFEE